MAEEPTGILRKEHDIIRKIAAEAADTAANIRATGKVETERIEKLHDFFKNFGDRCHHAKEES